MNNWQKDLSKPVSDLMTDELYKMSTRTAKEYRAQQDSDDLLTIAVQKAKVDILNELSETWWSIRDEQLRRESKPNTHPKEIPGMPITKPTSMKPFNLEQCLAGAPVGFNRLYLLEYAFGSLSPDKTIISGWFRENELHQWKPITHKIDGTSVETDSQALDLVMLPVEKKGWINIYPSTPDEVIIGTMPNKVSSTVFPTEEMAKAHTTRAIATVEMTWAE